MDLRSPVRIAGVQFANAVMNGAYIGSKTAADCAVLAKTSAGAVVVGSILIKPRRANPGQGYWPHKEGLYSLNSFGMPGGGVPYFTKYLPRIVQKVHNCHKPLIANVAGFSKEEFAELALLAQTAGADMVELNFGCPNVWDGGAQKRIVSYHAPLVAQILAHLKAQRLCIPVCVKISPLPPDILVAVSKAIADSGIVRAVTATNSYPNAATSAGTGTTADQAALAGMTGRALKPISLGVVRQLRQLLPADIDIIGCGGISSYTDALDFIAAGAKAVQLATALVDTGPTAFERILSPAVPAR